MRFQYKEGEDMRITATKAARNFSRLVNEVAYGRKRAVIERFGQPIAVLVPVQPEDVAQAERRDNEGNNVVAIREPLEQP